MKYVQVVECRRQMSFADGKSVWRCKLACGCIGLRDSTGKDFAPVRMRCQTHPHGVVIPKVAKR